MKIAEALSGVQQLYVDTAPFIYYIEDHPGYSDTMQRIFGVVESGAVEIFTSVITLTESLAKPFSTLIRRCFSTQSI